MDLRKSFGVNENPQRKQGKTSLTRFEVAHFNSRGEAVNLLIHDRLTASRRRLWAC